MTLFYCNGTNAGTSALSSSTGLVGVSPVTEATKSEATCSSLM